MRRLSNLLAILLIGDAIVGLMAPERQVAIWRFRREPRAWRRAMDTLSDRRNKLAFAASELVTGLAVAAATHRAIGPATSPRRRRGTGAAHRGSG